MLRGGKVKKVLLTELIKNSVQMLKNIEIENPFLSKKENNKT